LRKGALKSKPVEQAEHMMLCPFYELVPKKRILAFFPLFFAMQQVRKDKRPIGIKKVRP
jgi:hypothetical protein